MSTRRAILLTFLAAIVIVSPAHATHGYDMDCPDFASQAAAQHHMNAHPGDPDGLDGNDHDGRACESNPAPYYYGTATGPEPAPVPVPTPTPTPTATPTPSPYTLVVAKASRYRGRIVRVIDGDTIKVRLSSGKRRTVRLVGIDTPETRKPGVSIECGGKQATAFMRKLAFRRRRGYKVVLTTDPTQDRTDRYGRLLAYVQRTVDGRDLGAAMIAAGWAMSYVYDGIPFQRHDRYLGREAQARSAGRGVWGRCGGDFHSAQ